MILEDIFALDESSGYTLQGSFTRDLVFSKLWLIQELHKIQPHVGVMYVLGSWYGNLALLINKWPQVKVDHIVNVEPNTKFAQGSRNILKQLGVDDVELMQKDANSLDYRQLDSKGVVVNTSLTDMPGHAWFDHIPRGTLTVLQARDHDPGRQFHSAKDIVKRFPLSQVLYSGSLELQDPETEYTRFMVIGRK